jgi:hypothetical protein
MQPSDFAQLLAVIITIALLAIVGRRYGSEWLHLMKQLNDELLHRVPVYSAEAINRKEAEFIRDRLLKKLPVRAFLLFVVVVAAIAWWLTN